jgi:uncharacterized NAD-dependent epimerase/dehydratase family protein
MTTIPHAGSTELLDFARQSTSIDVPEPRGPPGRKAEVQRMPTAIIYCEANFGGIDGKTANGLIRHSEKYEILSVIDSRLAGRDSGEILNGAVNGIPVCRTLADALSFAKSVPDYFIIGMAPATGMLAPSDRDVVLDAIGHGMNIVNGLHEFLTDDPVFAAASTAGGVNILDVRKPRDKKHLRMFSGRIQDIACPRLAILGTDCAIGKRTTATILTRALNDQGLNAVMISTGQTGLMQGARFGVALDAIPSQFCCGELEAAILDAYDTENPDIIIVEGQGALSHPAFCTSAFILRGSAPAAVILQHAPERAYRCDFEKMEMPTPQSEIALIEAFTDTKVIGLTINHENMTDTQITAAIVGYADELGIPVTDALNRPPGHLADMVFAAFPHIGETLPAAA